MLATLVTTVAAATVLAIVMILVVTLITEQWCHQCHNSAFSQKLSFNLVTKNFIEVFFDGITALETLNDIGIHGDR